MCSCPGRQRLKTIAVIQLYKRGGKNLRHAAAAAASPISAQSLSPERTSNPSGVRACAPHSTMLNVTSHTRCTAMPTISWLRLSPAKHVPAHSLARLWRSLFNLFQLSLNGLSVLSLLQNSPGVIQHTDLKAIIATLLILPLNLLGLCSQLLNLLPSQVTICTKSQQ